MPLIRAGLAVLVGLGVIGFVAVPSLRNIALTGVPDLIDQIRRIVSPSLEIVHPIQASGSSELPDHEARLVIDTFTNTDWQASEATPSVTVTFQSPVDLGAVYVHSGSADAFVDLRRPSRLAFVFPDGSSKEIDLVDEHDPQQFDVAASSIEQLEIRVLSTNGPPEAPVALSEIEFFTKR